MRSDLLAALLFAALVVAPARGQADAEWAAATAEELLEAFPECTGVVIPEADSCPAISVGRQASLEDTCDEIARRNTLNWQPVGSAVVFAVPPAEIMDWSAIGADADQRPRVEPRVRPWALVGRPWSTQAGEWLRSGQGSTWRSVVDYREFSSDTLPNDAWQACQAWLGAMGLISTGPQADGWVLRARAGAVRASWRMGVLDQAIGLCGDVPRIPAPLTLTASGSLQSVLGRVKPPEAAPGLLAADKLHDLPIAVSVRETPADELLCMIAIACGGEWRASPATLVLDDTPRALESLRRVEADLFANGAQEPEHSRHGTRALLIGVSPDDAGHDAIGLGGGTQSLAIEVECGGETRLALLTLWAPPRAIEFALWRDGLPLGIVPGGPHVAVEALAGFCEGLGRPLPEDVRARIEQLAQTRVPLTRDSLVSLADSAGVELVESGLGLDELGTRNAVAIAHLSWGHAVALTDCDSRFVTLLAEGGLRARFPRRMLESGLSGPLFVDPVVAEGAR
ncbi:MAG TPA: hypothetical protein PLD23_05075 [Armatimonadota bacterium]|nr:hypothetical protein [Armatimonadota bacterium]HQK92851.1 hypothetical protein [Armatimonadota bacterium]